MRIRVSKWVLFPLLAIGALGVVVLWPYVDCYGRMHFGMAKSVALDGYTLSTMSCGSGGPTVILEGGLAQPKEAYYALQKRLFSKTRVLSYDHAGIGESTRNDNPRTLPSYAEELHALLAAENLEPPYILIGHSLGGHIIRYFTYLYPDEVSGLVFLDHPHEDWFRHIRANWTAEEQAKYFEFWTPKVTSPDQVDLMERLEYDHNNDLLRGKVIPPDMPVLMFTGNNDPHFREDPVGKAIDRNAWGELQFSLLYDVKDARQIVDWKTSHWPQDDKPAEVSREIREFIDKVSSGPGNQ